MLVLFQGSQPVLFSLGFVLEWISAVHVLLSLRYFVFRILGEGGGAAAHHCTPWGE